jgi:DNA-binding MarR family transcriptional regulator
VPVEAGLVARQPDPADGRVSLVAVTPDGTRVVSPDERSEQIRSVKNTLNADIASTSHDTSSRWSAMREPS